MIIVTENLLNNIRYSKLKYKKRATKLFGVNIIYPRNYEILINLLLHSLKYKQYNCDKKLIIKTLRNLNISYSTIGEYDNEN